jgi:hypothetical protein
VQHFSRDLVRVNVPVPLVKLTLMDPMPFALLGVLSGFASAAGLVAIDCTVGGSSCGSTRMKLFLFVMLLVLWDFDSNAPEVETD